MKQFPKNQLYEVLEQMERRLEKNNLLPNLLKMMPVQFQPNFLALMPSLVFLDF